MATVLIVDDHPQVVRVLQVALEREHEVLTASNGEEALRLLAERHPDVMLLDIIMPGLDGYRVLQRVRSDPETERTTVIMLTVKDQWGDVLVGLAVGADYYVPKPFDPQDVATLIRRHLAGEAEKPDEPAAK